MLALQSSVTVPKIKLPSLGYVHVLHSKVDGQAFNRRNSYRLWLGVEAQTKFGDYNAVHTVILRDISVTGIGFLFDKRNHLKIGDEVNVTFYDYVYNKAKKEKVPVKYVLISQVVRLVPVDDSTLLAGCVITRTANDIAKLVTTKQQERMKVGGKKAIYDKKSNDNLLKDTKLD